MIKVVHTHQISIVRPVNNVDTISSQENVERVKCKYQSERKLQEIGFYQEDGRDLCLSY